MLLGKERTELAETSRRMLADELTVGTSGNLSIRVGELVAITPSGVDYATLTPEAVVVIDLEGQRVEGFLEPSSEVPMHLAAYRATDAAAVVHAHPMFAAVLSTLVEEVPPIHYMMALLGGPVRVAPYATFGSQELAEQSAKALDGRFGVLLQNHGSTTVGDTLAKAYQRLVYLEWCCRMYYHARLLGSPSLIPADELERVGEKLARYGQAVESD
jgi:L-fuculose-phosphate aldolase